MIMHTIQVKKLSSEAFSKYGFFTNALSPKGESIGSEPAEFFRDIVQLRLGHSNVLSVSVLELTKRPYVINAMEYHNNCCEGMMPLDGDVIVQVAPACNSKEVPLKKVEAFYVPRGTLVVLNPGVWHESPYVVDQEKGHIFCMLPERTYMNDAYLVSIPEENQFLIENQ